MNYSQVLEKNLSWVINRQEAWRRHTYISKGHKNHFQLQAFQSKCTKEKEAHGL